MSNVVEIILICSLLENGEGDFFVPFCLEDINKWLVYNGHSTIGGGIKGREGGPEFFDAFIYCAAFNFFDINLFVEFLRTIKWRCPEQVQLLVNVNNGSGFRLIPDVVFERVKAEGSF